MLIYSIVVEPMPMSALVRSCKMDNVTFFMATGTDGVEVEHALIDRGNGEFTSMPKAVYDAQVEHLTENLLQP